MSTSMRSAGQRPVVGTPSTETPFMGRTAELDVLVGALDNAIRDGRPRYVLVDGAAGIGKSRLVREFLAAARERAPSAAIFLPVSWTFRPAGMNKARRRSAR
jgi:Cdc6-like AAA superfamily ATPase